MGPLKNPKTWVPYVNVKDCSKRICSLYCTQWCKYIILPSPPPPPAVSPEDDLGGATLSQLMIVIIAIVGSFFLSMGCYVVISRYCFTNNESSVSFTTGGVENQETLDLEMEDDDHNEEDPSSYVPWLVLGKGLDEDLINSITICKYKRGDGLVSGTDCSVCLGEFEEDESIRILPKCSHAFHVYCIDTWLKTHLNCPLCRANVCCVSGMPPMPPSLQPSPPLPPPVTTSDFEGRDAIIETREEMGRREIRRSISTGSLSQARATIADVLLIDQDEEMKQQEL